MAQVITGPNNYRQKPPDSGPWRLVRDVIVITLVIGVSKKGGSSNSGSISV